MALAQGIRREIGRTSLRGNGKLAAPVLTRCSSLQYAQLVIALEHLATLPYAHLERDFIMGYRRALGSAVGLRLFGPQIPEVKLDAESKRRYAVVSTGVKRTKVEAKVSDAGKGKYTVDGQHYDEFRFILAR